jgi:GNAT superfamily N-acetyltransferase
MNIKEKKLDTKGIRISVTEDDIEIGRAYLYLMHNDLHARPFALMEDVYVEEKHRSKGVGLELVKQVIEIAKKNNCYKLIATSRTSRPKVHELYQKLGFLPHGVEFRIDL